MKKDNSNKPYLFIETNACKDEYAGGDATGIFIGTWCLLGIYHWKPAKSNKVRYTARQVGIVIFNMCFGVARD